jgi:hypothetical protein
MGDMVVLLRGASDARLLVPTGEEIATAIAIFLFTEAGMLMVS